MKTENLVVALDSIITDIDNALDEMMDVDTIEADRARTMLMKATMRLNAVIDDLTGEVEPLPPVSGAV